MAYVSIPRDLSAVKSKIALNLTKRQLICFGTAAAIGIPAYIFTRGVVGNSPAAMLMIVIMLPLFFLAMYEKNGQPAEIILRNYLRVKCAWPGQRPYITENLYENLEKESENIAPNHKKATTAPVGKHTKCQGIGKGKSSRNARR
ncbi:PrgI family protein [Ruminococcaceae bacterium OttesenSCG-928-L11]|nr:PrgI family protein [Ruminococcaceae bacterium OttesenSCG-928-L11]